MHCAAGTGCMGVPEQPGWCCLEAPRADVLPGRGDHELVHGGPSCNSDEPATHAPAQMEDRIEDLLAAGVLDPAKVTRSGLTNACGIAGIMLTTQVGAQGPRCPPAARFCMCRIFGVSEGSNPEKALNTSEIFPEHQQPLGRVQSAAQAGGCLRTIHCICGGRVLQQFVTAAGFISSHACSPPVAVPALRGWEGADEPACVPWAGHHGGEEGRGKGRRGHGPRRFWPRRDARWADHVERRLAGGEAKQSILRPAIARRSAASQLRSRIPMAGRMGVVVGEGRG